jgi:hypothetical protein
MDENSTHDSLILYYFNETGMTKSVLVQKQIDTFEEVKEEYQHLIEVFDRIDKILLQPSEKSVDAILRYGARSLKHKS